MFLQETYELLDAIFYDKGTSTDYHAWTSTDFSDATRISRDSECTTLTPQDDWDTQRQTLPEQDLIIEFDLNSTYSSSSHFLRFYNGNTSIVTFAQENLAISSNQWYHLKVILSSGNIQVFVDDTRKINQSISNSPNQIRLVLNNTTSTNLKYKNFKVYSA